MSITDSNHSDIQVTDYHIFEDASKDASVLHSSLEEQKSIVLTASKEIYSPDVFVGEIADSCKDALNILDQRMALASDNFETLIHFFHDVCEEYKKGDDKASNLILTCDKKGVFSYSAEVFPMASPLMSAVCKNALKFSSDARSTYALGWDKTKDYFYGDCFGFVLACFEGVTDLGYNPQTMGGTNPATATSYLTRSGKFTQIPITSSTALQPGDVLICPTNGAEHAEIYIGNGQLASAPSAARPMQHPIYNFGATYILRYNQKS